MAVRAAIEAGIDIKRNRQRERALIQRMQRWRQAQVERRRVNGRAGV